MYEKRFMEVHAVFVDIWKFRLMFLIIHLNRKPNISQYVSFYA